MIRCMADIAADGASFDALGYPVMALWMACFIQAYEATTPEALADPLMATRKIVYVER